MDVSGKKAIVFGGTSGIGLATVRLLAAQGCQVVAVSRNPQKAMDLPDGLPDGVVVKKCDVLDRKGLAELFSDCGRFDILVSSATGGSRAMGPFMEMDMDGFQASFDKLWGYANVVRFGAGHLNKNGAVVLVSGSPARKCKPGQIALSSVGGAVEAMVRALAPELAPIRINTVSPGVIDTPMQTAQGAERVEIYKKMTGNNVIARAGRPDEVAQAIIFAITNDFVTGTTIDVDGGWLIS